VISSIQPRSRSEYRRCPEPARSTPSISQVADLRSGLGVARMWRCRRRAWFRIARARGRPARLVSSKRQPNRCRTFGGGDILGHQIAPDETAGVRRTGRGNVASRLASTRWSAAPLATWR
jgi:hypothetical protein